jgi:hypothetical protein
MTIIREPRDPRIDALHTRASAHGEAFAERLCAIVEGCVQHNPADWPQLPAPGAARGEAKRIMEACTELAAALTEGSVAVRARLGAYAQQRALERGELRSAHALTNSLIRDLSELLEAAADFYQVQPRTKRPDPTRAGMLLVLREHFRQAGVPWEARADEYGNTSLAVDAAAIALKLLPAAAREAIRRLNESRPEST